MERLLAGKLESMPSNSKGLPRPNLSNFLRY
jgi:hypothetical protein